MKFSVPISRIERRKRGKALRFAEMKVLDTWYAQVNIDALKEHFRKDPDMSARLSKKQAHSQSSEAVVPKLTAVMDGRRKIKDEPPVLYLFQQNVENFEKSNQNHIQQYRKSLQADRLELFERYRFQDSAIKVVGLGSVGTRCYVSLFLADEDDPLFLQGKEARRSVLESPTWEEPFCASKSSYCGRPASHAGRK